MSQDGVPEAQRSPESASPQKWELPLTKLQCPRCDSERIRRSHRRSALERMLALLLLPYRCDFCNFRFFRTKWAGDSQVKS